MHYLGSAGTGSVLTVKGEVEMDAVIMDGRKLNVGAVACVNNIANPITLARAVMEEVRSCDAFMINYK